VQRDTARILDSFLSLQETAIIDGRRIPKIISFKSYQIVFNPVSTNKQAIPTLKHSLRD
jgi:hypothetical protein